MMTQIPAEEKEEEEEVGENEGYVRGEKRVSGLLVTSTGKG